MIQVKRVYEPPAESDGFRVLVERLWPRGISKERAHLDLWLKDVAPSPGLREWYRHDVSKWDEFRRRYRAELEQNPGAVDQLRRMAGEKNLTLVYAARDEQHNSAGLLMDYLGRSL
jgi:uncharacterized protein YeaO (DUF488 family)